MLWRRGGRQEFVQGQLEHRYAVAEHVSDPRLEYTAISQKISIGGVTPSVAIMVSERQIHWRWDLVLVALVAWVVGVAVALTPDGVALIEFKRALTVVSPLLQSWNESDASPCSWGGINCTDSGHVSNITLTVVQEPLLEGNISSSLGKLKFLEGIILDNNLLSGSIPPELGNLRGLRTLSLGNNTLTGEIPPELGNCSSLSYLSVWHNLLSGIVPEIIYKNLNLTYLDISGNNFSGDITPGLNDLSKLPFIESVYIEVNSFSGTLPPSIGNATSLVSLSLGVSAGDPLSGNWGQKGGFGGEIPKELGKLMNLTYLTLGGNNFPSGIPPELMNLSSLNFLDLGQTNLRGEIPPWLGNMSSLGGLILRINELNGTIPPSLGGLANLTWIDCSHNNITGSIPESFTSLFNLESLSFSNNSLTGQIPTNLSKSVTKLKNLYLYNNSLSGLIPEDFGKFMPNLEIIHLAYNLFNGSVPDGLCEGKKLKAVSLNNNNLQGAIPLSLGSCPSLYRFRFSNNQLSSIPDGFGKNTSLEIFEGARNQFTGELPRGLGANSQLAFLDLSENRFTGDISILDFSQLAHNLSFLNLAKNNLTGNIPNAMGACKSLFQVDLSYNSLSGDVPLTFGNLSNLQELYLQGNMLTKLHPSIYSGFATTLRSLNLAKNAWSASIAIEIGALKKLKVLNLSYGGFVGPIPSTLENLDQLEVLDLSHNNLTGEVPSSLGELMTSLILVNVSFNHLTGSLPPSWVKFFIADPTLFHGNPGLCSNYDDNNLCIELREPKLDQSSKRKSKLSIKTIVGVILGAIALVLLACFVAYFWRHGFVQGQIDSKKEIYELNLTNEPWLLTFEEIMKATENLSDEYIIGRGAHGVVYKVKCISNTHPCIVVKKIDFTNTKTTMPHKSFWAEVKSLGKARHRNVVKLLGFIRRDEIGLLLYEFMPKGDLHSALHNTEEGNDLHLTWEDRLRIAKGVAHGLAYLHHDFDTPIVHRDIKSSNVLLDDDLEAHISDFGLAKMLDMQHGSEWWSLSTQNVLGTYGYIAPEVGLGLKATPQMDVYSYGVLLLELLTKKEPTHDPSYGEALDIVAWVKENMHLNVELKKNKVEEFIFDPWLLHPKDSGSPIAIDEILFVQEIALQCTQKKPTNRPTMRDVLNMLEKIKT